MTGRSPRPWSSVPMARRTWPSWATGPSRRSPRRPVPNPSISRRDQRRPVRQRSQLDRHASEVHLHDRPGQDFASRPLQVGPRSDGRVPRSPGRRAEDRGLGRRQAMDDRFPERGPCRGGCRPELEITIAPVSARWIRGTVGPAESCIDEFEVYAPRPRRREHCRRWPMRTASGTSPPARSPARACKLRPGRSAAKTARRCWNSW